MRPIRALKRLPVLSLQTYPPARSFTHCPSLRRAFEEGDVAILRDKKHTSSDGFFIKLQRSKSTHTHRGIFDHDSLIGKHPRQIVTSSRGSAYRIYEPTLADYVRLTPRIVTPIYPSDANLIVSLLDIHVDTPSPGAKTTAPLEILEAGTGHGALTLHLSRAIHAANPPRPVDSLHVSAEADEPEDAVYLGESISDLQEANLQTWNASRRAVVHTLDISSKHSKHARKIVSGFRRGIYAGNVDFHVGDISEWIGAQKASRKTDDAFLSYVFLDLPDADSHLANVASVLHVNGLLAVFNPSITQIVDCVERIRKEKLPYVLDQVVELGVGNIRQWDVRAVKPRATLRNASPKANEDQPELDTSSQGSNDLVEERAARDNELIEETNKEQERWVTICRPKVGDRVIGGGFLALWRRMDIYIREPVESPIESPTTA